MNHPTGKVYLVGAGPGDPELLTIKALRTIQNANAILYDRLVHPSVLNYAPTNAKKIYVGKKKGHHTLPQDEINQLLYQCALQYPSTVRLKGGNPFLFGRGSEELLFLLEKKVQVEVIPGISSALGIPPTLQIPLTHRQLASSLAILSGHLTNGSIPKWHNLQELHTLIILMGTTHRITIAKQLLQAGRKPQEPVIFIEQGTTPNQKVVHTTLQNLAQNLCPPISPPALMIVGNVCQITQNLLNKTTNTPSIFP